MTEVRDTDIAIVGMACRFPGASTPEEFWRNVRDGVISIRRLSREELLEAGADESELDDPAYVPVAAVLDDVEGFDAAFFGYGPRDAAILDPQHRHFLEVAWQALEHAGHAAGTSHARVGVFAGSGLDTYLIRNLVTNPDLVESTGLFLLRHTGNDKDFLATEVSYKLNLTGPSVNVQTACSTSLVAIHLASQSLLNGECDVALAGGSTIEVPPGRGYRYHEGEVLSPDGVCRPFDAGSRGTVLGSGTGAVVLRRLRDAIDDGDTIYAVIRGSAINNDGSGKVSYLAPSVDGHAAAISEALGVAEVGADTISFFESHGTGTAIGDPIEITAATQAFRENGAVLHQYCRVGSTKANIGHLDTAAGVASIIKTAMALHHRQLPPLPTLTEPSPEIDFASSPFYLSAAVADWVPVGGARRAGVSSLGIGGTNAHVILEGWDADEASASSPRSTEPDEWHVLPLSARSEAALDASANRLARFLRDNPSTELADVAFTLQDGRAALPHRRVVVARSVDEAIQALEELDPRRQARGHAPEGRPEVVFMFPGGGAQYPQMARELYEAEPEFRHHADACFSIIERLTESDLRPLVFPGPEVSAERAGEELSHTAAALPAIFTVEYALAQFWMSRGVAPASMTGHSLGEYTAACLAGVMTLEDALRLVVLRARLVDRVSVGGGMLSVGVTEDELGELPAGLSVASVNAPGQCVVSGEARFLDALEADLDARDISHQRLQLTAAGHSAMLDPILDEFLEGVRRIQLHPPTRPYVSNVTGTWVRPEDAVRPEYWVRHLRHTVRFADGLETLLEDGDRVLLEVGPGQTLRSLAGQQATKPLAAISSIRHRDDAVSDRAYWLRAFGQLWASGVAVEWGQVRSRPGRRIPLPTYPFEHQRHWIEPGRGVAARTRPAMDEWFSRPTWDTLPLARSVRSFGPDERWLILGRPDGIGWDLARALRLVGQDVVSIEPRGRLFRETNSVFAINPLDPAHYRGLIGALRREGRYPTRIVHTWLAESPPTGRALIERLPAAQRLGFDSLLLLSQALIEEGVGSPVEITIVTAGAEGPSTVENAAPEQALVQGLARVLPREAPEFSVRTVDVEPRAHGGRIGRRAEQHLAQCVQILDELGDGSDFSVAYRGGKRWVKRLAPLELPPAAGRSVPVRAGGTYLITGGLGGIGLTLARELAQRHEVRLALLSRGGEAGASPEARAAVRELEALGAQVLLLAADVADPRSVATALDTVHRTFGPVHGVVHAAGITRDAPAGTKSLAEAHDVLRPKVLGTAVLDRALTAEPLDWLLLCSSTSALVGPAGQVDYVAANAFLDAFAQSRQGPGRTVAVDWGIWRDVGMVGRQVGVAAPGIEVHPLLGHLTSNPLDSDLVFEQRLSPSTHWPLDEHRLGDGTPLLPGSSYLELAAAAAARAGLEQFELAELTLLQPVWGSEQTATSLRVRMQQEPTRRRLLVQSALGEGAPWRDSAEATVLPAEARAERLDVAALEARFAGAAHDSGRGVRGAQEDLLRFGPRWHNLTQLRVSSREAFGRIELGSEFLGDLTTYLMHPALLDTAIGLGLSLLPATDPSAGVFVPVSYRRVVADGPIPASLVVHVVATSLPRFPEDEFASFDVRIADVSGRVVLEVEQATFQRVHQEVFARPIKERAPATSPLLEAGAKLGISPREGAEVFTRILAGTPLPQVVASSIPLRMVEDLIGGQGSTSTRIDRPGGDAGYVEPRDDVERTIAGYFSELLGVERVSIDDHFFDLGGHSLIAIRLFSRLRQTYGLDLGLASLFDAPTVERLAALVPRDGSASVGPRTETTEGTVARAQPQPGENEHQYVVTIQGGGTELPFFCVHGRGGNVLELRDLSRRVGADIPFFGIQARGIDGRRPPHASIEEMARDYVTALLESRPHGPYLLGGYSGGGVVALEMAQQLRAAGYEVAGLVLIDSYHPTLKTARARGRYGWIVDAVRDGGPRYLALLAEESARRHLHLPPPAELNGKWRLNGSSPELDDADPAALASAHGFADLSQHFVEIQSRYRPRPYDGPITLLRASTFAFPRALGWSQSEFPRMRIVDVQGDHSGMMREPYVSGLAAALRDALLARQPSVRAR